MRSGRSPSVLLAAAGFVVLATGLISPAARAEESGQLSEAAETAVLKLYPGASVVGVRQEREQDVSFYEVVVRQGKKTMEIEVTPDGAIGEIETRVPLAEVPRVALDEILKRTDGAPVRAVERHEIRGVAKNGTFVPVDPPRIVYEVGFVLDGASREVAVAADGTALTLEQDDDEDDDEEEDERSD